MLKALQEQMSMCVEFFHYSLRFENNIFVLNFDERTAVRELLGDLRVLHVSQILPLLCYPHAPETETIFRSWTAKGCKFEYFQLPPEEAALKEQAGAIRKALAAQIIPVLAWVPAGSSVLTEEKRDTLALFCTKLFSATKLFFLGDYRGLEVAGQFYSHPNRQEIEGFLDGARSINIGKGRLARLHAAKLELTADLILLEAKAGALFQEIFTHRGAGTLISEDYPNVFRKAELSDVLDISFIVNPYIKKGTILPVSEDDIAANIDNYYVFTVNNQIVATGMLAEYENAYEIGKICTLPRYQRRGRAKSLVQNMTEMARQRGKKFVFSLSIEPKMWVFFNQLGFTEVARESLPQSWQQHYDLARPSRAFQLELCSKPV